MLCMRRRTPRPVDGSHAALVAGRMNRAVEADGQVPDLGKSLTHQGRRAEHEAQRTIEELEELRLRLRDKVERVDRDALRVSWREGGCGWKNRE